ncbi:MAG: hypothetical protein QOH06_4989 [Acidobacteriota bacterium]|jgi:hypothetical protein|nr:hypothetical protein [Acidobacteriota bacterium]
MKDQDIQNGLRQLARETRPAKPLPSAEQLWWRAEVIRRLVSREEAARKAEKPLLWSQAVGLFLVVAALLSLFIYGEPRFLALLFAIVVAPLTALLAFFFLPRET